MLSPATDFALPTHQGEPYTLSARFGVGPTVVAFYRGHWCPYCRRYLCKLQANLDRIRSLGGEVAAVGPEGVETAARLAADLGLAFPLLCDVDGSVIAQFGVRNAHASSLLPHPAVFVVNREGGICFRSIDRNYKKRTTVRTICSELAKLAAPQAPAGPSSAG